VEGGRLNIVSGNGRKLGGLELNRRGAAGIFEKSNSRKAIERGEGVGRDARGQRGDIVLE